MAMIQQRCSAKSLSQCLPRLSTVWSPSGDSDQATATSARSFARMPFWHPRDEAVGKDARLLAEHRFRHSRSAGNVRIAPDVSPNRQKRPFILGCYLRSRGAAFISDGVSRFGLGLETRLESRDPFFGVSSRSRSRRILVSVSSSSSRDFA